jgi:hypothetical protein
MVNDNTLLVLAAAGFVGFVIYKWNNTPEIIEIIEDEPIVISQQEKENINSEILPQKDVSPPKEEEESNIVRNSAIGIGVSAGIIAAAAGLYTIGKRKYIQIYNEGNIEGYKGGYTQGIKDTKTGILKIKDELELAEKKVDLQNRALEKFNTRMEQDIIQENIENVRKMNQAFYDRNY